MNFFILIGDANHDRTANALDFNALASSYGQPNANFATGDFNYDGAVNRFDFSALAMNFGRSLAPPASAPLAESKPRDAATVLLASLFSAAPASHDDDAIGNLFAQVQADLVNLD